MASQPRLCAVSDSQTQALHANILSLSILNLTFTSVTRLVCREFAVVHLKFELDIQKLFGFM